MLKLILRIFRSTVFLTWLVVMLFTASVASSLFAYRMVVQAGVLSSQLTTSALAHRKQIAAITEKHRKQLQSAILKTKAKARLRRVAVAVPVAGVAAAAAFEEIDYREWVEENPDGTRAEYGCVIYTASIEVMDEFVDEVGTALPDWARPSPDTLREWLPECEGTESKTELQ